jgi:hypothetical protein
MSCLDRQLLIISRDVIQLEGEGVVCDLSKLIHWCLKWIVDSETLAMVYMNLKDYLIGHLGDWGF